MRDCAAHLCDGVPDAYRYSGGLGTPLIKVIPGELLDNMQANFDVLAQKEAAVLGKAAASPAAPALTAAPPTTWPPAAHYYPCNGTLRPCFTPGRCACAGDLAARRYCFCPKATTR